MTVASGQVPSTQTNFPKLSLPTDNRFRTIGNGGHVANANGYDIRPYSDSALTTALDYELVYYNATTGQFEMHVKIPSLSDGYVTYFGYGDTSLTTDGSNGANTFSNNFRNVYHLKDGTTLSVADSVGNSNGTNNSATAASGKIDGGSGHASASNQYINTNSTTSGQSCTFSAWVNATSFPAAYNAVLYRNASNSDASGILVKSNGKVAYVLVATSQFFIDGGSTTLSTGTWYLIHLAYDGTNGLKCYVNGSSDATSAANGNYNSGAIANLIGRDAVNNRNWNGSIDEVRYSVAASGTGGARSANWITTEYNNQNAPGTFETLGTEVAVTAASTGNMFLLFP